MRNEFISAGLGMTMLLSACTSPTRDSLQTAASAICYSPAADTIFIRQNTDEAIAFKRIVETGKMSTDWIERFRKAQNCSSKENLNDRNQFPFSIADASKILLEAPQVH